MKTKTWIEVFVTSFAKEDKKQKETMFAKNVILRVSKTNNKIKCSFFFRKKEEGRTKKTKIFEIFSEKVKGRYKIDESDYNKLALIIVNNNKITQKDVKETEKFKRYFDDFKKEIESRVKNEIDINKKVLINFNKYFDFFTDKTEQDINERTLIDFCNYVVKNATPTGSAVQRNKDNCYAIKMSITTLRKFFNFLFLKNKIKKDTLEIVKNFVFTEFFVDCKKQLKHQTAFSHFNSLETVRNFYLLVLDIKQNLEDFLEGKDDNKEYLTTKLLKYKKTELLTEKRAEDFLYKMYVTEFLLLTGIRGIDFFRIKVKNIKWDDGFIFFEKTKNSQEYYLYLTNYLYNLAFDIYNLAQNLTNEDTFVATTHSTLRNFFNTFFKKKHDYDINIHGFRHTFKTLTVKYLNYNNLVIEEQLQHSLKGIEKSYMKSDMREQRLKLLEDYRLLVTPIYYKHFFDIKSKERLEENISKEIRSFFDSMIEKYNISVEQLYRILLKNL